MELRRKDKLCTEYWITRARYKENRGDMMQVHHGWYKDPPASLVTPVMIMESQNLEICRIRWWHNHFCLYVMLCVQIRVPLSLLRVFSIKTYEIDIRSYSVIIIIMKQMFTFIFNSSDHFRLLYILSLNILYKWLSLYLV